jgi:valine--pyruvate aminotransferase
MDGLDVFRQAVAEQMSRRYGRTVTRAEVIAVPGVQAALRYVHLELRARGRRVLYPVGLEFPGGVALAPSPPSATGPYRITRADDGTYKPFLDVDALRDWTDVGAVVLSRPHNPTGRDWSTAELTALAEAASARGALLVLDETCAPPVAPITLRDQPPIDAGNVVHLFSLSKLGLAGERVGIAVARPAVIDVLARMQRQLVIQPPKAGQYLGLRLLRTLSERPELRKAVVTQYQERWEAAHRAFAGIGAPGVRLMAWEGGLFLWMEWDGPPSDLDVVDVLLGEGIAAMPGSALFVPGDGAAERPHALRWGLGAPADAVAGAVRRAVSIIAQARGVPAGSGEPAGGAGV